MNTIPQQRVSILGAGEMSRAMQRLLAAQSLRTWQRHGPASDQRLADVATNADAIVFCLPAQAYDEIATKIVPIVAPHCVCIGVAKGLDAAARTATEIFQQALARRCHYATLYGPMIAEALQQDRAGFAGVAADAAPARALVHTLFDRSALRLRDIDDANGANWCGILKNLYAVLFGCVDAMNLGENWRGFLVVRALEELSALLPQLGGAAATAYDWPGLGDLITTATSVNSHHYMLGYHLAGTPQTPLTGEAVHTVQVLQQTPRFALTDYPLLQLAAALIATRGGVDIARQLTQIAGTRS